MDWVSTRRYYSDKRVECSPTGDHAPQLIQAKITLNKPPTPQEREAQPLAQQQAERANDHNLALVEKVTAKVGSIWQALFGAKQIRASLDPNHKELWFMNWKARSDQQAHNVILSRTPMQSLFHFYNLCLRMKIIVEMLISHQV